MNAVRRLSWMAALVLAAGCGSLTGSRDTRPTVAPATGRQPSPQDLVAYVNRNAAAVEAIESSDLALEVKAGSQGGGLSGQLFCQKPKNFRLRAKGLGQPVADFGSNDNEFWFWVKQDNPPYLYHCGYNDLARGDVQLPFPFQPDWVLETLGMATLTAPAENFSVVGKKDGFELVERASSAQGKLVYKYTAFRAGTASGATPQITQYRLHDERNQLVALADVESVRRDAATGATVPTQLRLKWPQQKLEMEMKLDGLRVYNTPALTQRAPEIFQRPQIRDVQGFDLARRAPDASPASLQRTGGFRGQ